MAVYPNSPAAIPKTNKTLNSSFSSNIRYAGGITLTVNLSKFHNEEDSAKGFL